MSNPTDDPGWTVHDDGGVDFHGFAEPDPTPTAAPVRISGAWSAETDLSKVIDAVAEAVAARINDELEPLGPQGWAHVPVNPPWSGWCFNGEHERCNGSAPPAEGGCQCPHHRGEQVGGLALQRADIVTRDPR